MAFRVEIAKSAELQLEELYLWVVGRAPTQGVTWFNRLEKAILALDLNPERYPIAPESFDADQPVRVLNFGRSPHVYRVFFTVDDSAKVVHVVPVRRGVRRQPEPGEPRGE